MKGIYVGEFSEKDLEIGLDEVRVSEMKEKTGMNYTNTKLVKRDGKIVGLRIWVCNAEDFEI